MKYFMLFITLVYAIPKNTCAQSKKGEQEFNKNLLESLDNWVALPMSKDSTYAYGYVYLDNMGGLTFHNEGNFKIVDGKFINTVKRTMMQRSIERISPSKMMVAVIPNIRFKEIEVEESPQWLKIYYAGGPNSVDRQFRLGFTYNQWNQPEKALPFLEAVKKANADYAGLAYEFSFSYNALKQYTNALEILTEAIKKNPNDCSLYQEIMYAQMNLKEVDKAMETVKIALSVCKDKAVRAPMLRDLLFHYYNKKDKEQFKTWAEIAKKEMAGNAQALQIIAKWESELN